MPDEIQDLTIVSETVDASGNERWTANLADVPLKALDGALAEEYAENLILQQDMRSSLEAMKLWHDKYASATEPAIRLLPKVYFVTQSYNSSAASTKLRSIRCRLRLSMVTIQTE
jgi:hypothetical protein